MKRIASIWLPRLAIERWAKSSDCRLTAGRPDRRRHARAGHPCRDQSRGGARRAVGRAADRCAGARSGAGCRARRPEGDAALVQRLAIWAGRWSPLVEVDGDGLRLDVSGVAHLFGGEHGLAFDIQRRFAGIGLTVRIAIAPTAAAAWALAHSCVPLPSGERLLSEDDRGVEVLRARLTPRRVSASIPDDRAYARTIGA